MTQRPCQWQVPLGRREVDGDVGCSRYWTCVIAGTRGVRVQQPASELEPQEAPLADLVPVAVPPVESEPAQTAPTTTTTGAGTSTVTDTSDSTGTGVTVTGAIPAAADDAIGRATTGTPPPVTALPVTGTVALPIADTGSVGVQAGGVLTALDAGH